MSERTDAFERAYAVSQRQIQSSKNAPDTPRFGMARFGLDRRMIERLGTDTYVATDRDVR